MSPYLRLVNAVIGFFWCITGRLGISTQNCPFVSRNPPANLQDCLKTRLVIVCYLILVYYSIIFEAKDAVD